MTHYNFIHNEDQIKKFYELFYKDTFSESDDIVYMLLLAFRRKYEKEDNLKNLSDRMFARKVIKNDDFNNFLQMIKHIIMKKIVCYQKNV